MADYIKLSATDGSTTMTRTFVAVKSDSPYTTLDNAASVRRTLDGVEVRYGRTLDIFQYLLRVKAVDNDIREAGVTPGTISDLKAMLRMRPVSYTLTTNDGASKSVAPVGKVNFHLVTPAVGGTDALYFVGIAFQEIT